MIKNKRGFTLIELLVVCLIIGILTSIVLLSTRVASRNSRDGQRKTDLTKIAAALDSYKADNKAYPTSCSTCSTDTTFKSANGASANQGLAELLPRYLSSMPKDPLSDAYYLVRSDGYRFKLLAKSETISTSDDIEKAAEFRNTYNNCTNCQIKCFQISSSPAAIVWQNTTTNYCQ